MGWNRYHVCVGVVVIYTCRTRHFGKEFFCLCFYWLNFLCVVFFCCIFPCYILFCCIFYVLFFRFILFRVVLKSFHSLWQCILLYIRQIFCTNLKLFSWRWELVLIHHLVTSLSLFKSYLILIKLNCLLLFLLILLIS